MAIDALQRILSPSYYDLTGSESVAVRDADGSHNYAELYRRAAEIQDELGRLGKFSRVVIAGAKGLDTYAAWLACLGLGVTFCPVDPVAPPERTQKIFDDFKPDVALFDGAAELVKSQVKRDTPVIELPQVDSRGSERKFSRLGVPKDSVAYVIYTSGTSGYPKGVAILRRSLNWFLGCALDRFDVRHSSRWSHHPSLAFDLSVLDIFGSIATRSSIHPLVDAISRAFPGRWINDNKIEVWQSVPSVVQSMILARSGEAGHLRTLRRVILCGEPFQRRWAEYLLEFCSDSVQVFNCYGPTETTVFCSVETLRRGYVFSERSATVSIGDPFKGCEFTLSEVGGGAGEREIVVSGDGVGPGYIGLAPGENDGYSRGSRIIPPRAYATGDLVDVFDGKMYCRGRADSQVKIKGHRFELEEIDAVAASLGLSNPVSFVVGERVFLACTQLPDLGDREIRDELKKSLPEYAIPLKVYLVSEIPRGANDKVTRSKLAEGIGV